MIFQTGLSEDDDPANAGENHGDRAIADALANFGMMVLNGGQDVKPAEKQQKTLGPPEGSFAWRKQQFEMQKKKDWRRWQ